MKLSPSVSNSLNAQINAEFTASYHYLAMAAYFDSQSLSGFAAWFRTQSVEENGHGMKIFDYIQRRGGAVKLADVSALDKSFQSSEDVVSSALAMEEAVTASVHKLHALAVKENDPATVNLMNWFVDEQVEEEDTFTTLLEKVQAAGNDRWRLQVLDGEISSRA